MSFLDKLKSKFGLGDILSIEKLKKEEGDVYKKKGDVAKEELEANEALLDWSTNEESENLKKAVEDYYVKKKEIIEAYQEMIDKAKEEYLLPLEKISQKVEILEETTDDQEKTEKKLDKAQRKKEKREFDLEKESSKLDRNIDKIRKKEIDVQKSTSEVQNLENDLANLNKRVAEMKVEVQEFKFSTLKGALMKLNEYEKAYSDKLQEVFPERQKLIDSIPGEVKITPPEPQEAPVEDVPKENEE